MYFPISVPLEYRFPKASKEGEEPICISSNRDRSLILLLTKNTLHIWFCKPCVQITSFQRSVQSIQERGENVQGFWQSDATTIAITTDKGCLIFFKLEIDNVSNEESLYLKKGYSRKQQKAYDALFLGEGIPALTLKELHSFNLNENISSVALLRDELVVATYQGNLTRVRWNSTVSGTCSISVNEIQFSYDLQNSSGRQLKPSTEYVTDLEFSPLLGGFVAVLSDGRGFFLSAPNARFDQQNLHGVWAPDLTDATCVHANHKYRLIVFGCQSGKGKVYHIDPATGSLLRSHYLTVSTRQYPDAGTVGGAITKLAWTPDECAIIAAWKKGGIAVWSVFGALLYCSLKTNYGFPTPSTQNNFIVQGMEWGAEGYQLWMSVESVSDVTSTHLLNGVSTHSDADVEGGSGPVSTSPTENHADTLSRRGQFDFIQLHFVKSPLTVNPCYSNHKHLFLQAEDRLYVNLGSEKTDTEADSSNILIANKQWRVVPILYTYLGSNWPIRYSAMDESGLSIAIAGRTGLAHYSLVRRRWVLFGNEAQEKSMVVCGGLIWWREFIGIGCFNINSKKDEIRFYPSTCKLDNRFCATTNVPYAVLLINTFRDYFICLCADKHIMIFSIQLPDVQTVPTVELRRIQDVSLNGYLPHPMCVTFLTLSYLSADKNPSKKENSVTETEMPESILLNVAGNLLMFQRDWSGPQPKQSSNRFRAVPFCNPMKIASSVENVWMPDIEAEDKKLLRNSLWLSCGAAGMKVWLALFSQESVQNKSFLAKRIMLPFAVDLYPLAILAEDAVILGAGSDHSASEMTTPGSPTASLSTLFNMLDFSTLERTSEIYLHQVLRQLLRRNLGYNALQLVRCFTALPYFSHILELLLHEVLEEEATSKEPIPDPLLPRVVLFSKEFPQYRKTVAHCARKTEIALWEHLFSTVGSPKALFEECLVNGDLDTASSYLIILQNLEKFYVSRQHATLLLESALERRSWSLARDVVRFLKRIDRDNASTDPHEAEIEPVSRPLPPRYGPRFAAPVVNLEENEGFNLNKQPLTRNPSLSFYETEAPSKEKSTKSESARGVTRKHSGSLNLSTKSDEPEKHDVEVLLYRHARKLLATYRIRDLGMFAANLEEYELVGFLRKERLRSSKLDDPVQAVKQLHTDFSWPLPILTHSAFYRSLRKYNTRPPALTIPLNSAPAANGKEHVSVGDLGGSHSTREIVLSPVRFNIASPATPDLSEDVGTEASDLNGELQSQSLNLAGDLSRSNSESQLHDMTMELANRGPQQSELELRYLFQVMAEAECYDWCLLIALVLRDSSLFSRNIGVAASKSEKEPLYINKLSTTLNSIKRWISEECLGYKPFLTSLAQDVDNVDQLCKRLIPKCASNSPPATRVNSISTESAHSDTEENATGSTPKLDSMIDSSQIPPSDSCIIS